MGLERFYGRPAPPEVTDPFEMILYENVAYLAADAKRLAAWKTFRTRIGRKPARILAAPQSELLAIARAGIIAPDRVSRIQEGLHRAHRGAPAAPPSRARNLQAHASPMRTLPGHASLRVLSVPKRHGIIAG